MSYDIRLKDHVSGDTIQFDNPHLMTGGTYAIGGTTEAWLNITYNYSDWYYRDGVFPSFPDDQSGGIRAIYGMTGAESIPVLKSAIAKIQEMPDLTDEQLDEYRQHNCTGYWVPTKENVLRPLYKLIAIAQLRPDGVWDGD